MATIALSTIRELMAWQLSASRNQCKTKPVMEESDTDSQKKKIHFCICTVCTPVVRFSDVYWILPLCYYWWLQPYTTLNENWNQPLNGRLFSRTLHSSPVSSCKCCVISVVCSLTDCQADPVWSSEMQLFSFVNPPFLLLLCRSWEKHLRPCG